MGSCPRSATISVYIQQNDGSQKGLKRLERGVCRGGLGLASHWERWLLCIVSMSVSLIAVKELFGAESDLLQVLIDNLPDYIFVKETQNRILMNQG
jgi:hypothetical protein